MPAGLILGTCILIAAECRRATVPEMLRSIRVSHGEVDLGLSTVSVIELTHGYCRARTDADRNRRRDSADVAIGNLQIYPVTLEIAELAGRIEGEQAERGFAIPFEDLVIGSTALHLGFDVLTFNLRHFQLIPGLRTVTL